MNTLSIAEASRIDGATKLPHTPGVYLLTHCQTGDTYVGSSKNVRLRLYSHLSNLKNGLRPNILFNRLETLYFKVVLLESTTAETRLICEHKWMDKIVPTLNQRAVSPILCVDGIRPIRSRAISMRLDSDLRSRLMSIGRQAPFKPTLTQLVEQAIREYVEKHDAKPKK